MNTLIFFTKSVSIAGGKEKVLCGLCNYLVRQGHTIKIITYDGSLISFFPLHSSIAIETLPLCSALPKRDPLLKLIDLYKDIRSYKNSASNINGASTIITTDYLISSVLFLSNKAWSKKMIAWEHLSYTIALSTVWAIIRRKVYRNIKQVVALNKEEAAFYKKMGCATLCIANPIEPQQVLENKLQNMIWVGSLTKDKGIDDLLQLGLRLKKNDPCIPIHIYGSGACLQEFSTAIVVHQLQDILILKGTTKDITAIYANAALLIVTAKHECFPTVVLEAFSFGIPVISFDCPTGPRNIITEGKNGFLIPQGNVTMMTNKIEALLTQQVILKAMGKAAHETACAYNPEVIDPQWLQVIA